MHSVLAARKIILYTPPWKQLPYGYFTVFISDFKWARATEQYFVS